MEWEYGGTRKSDGPTKENAYFWFWSYWVEGTISEYFSPIFCEVLQPKGKKKTKSIRFGQDEMIFSILYFSDAMARGPLAVALFATVAISVVQPSLKSGAVTLTHVFRFWVFSIFFNVFNIFNIFEYYQYYRIKSGVISFQIFSLFCAWRSPSLAKCNRWLCLPMRRCCTSGLNLQGEGK